jgi:hypothetical protein
MKEIILVCDPLLFFSKADEKLFKKWVKKIRSINKVEKDENKIYLYFKTNEISDNDLDDLIALFVRYSFDSKQLNIFVNKDNEDFFPRVDGVGTESYHKVYPRRDVEKLTKTEVKLKCTPLRFYTKNDENLLFGLIETVRSITGCYGVGQTLYIIVDSEKISGEDVGTLKALFMRYRYDQKQLKKLERIFS